MKPRRQVHARLLLLVFAVVLSLLAASCALGTKAARPPETPWVLEPGIAWHQQSTSTTSYLNSVYFVDARSGWAVGNSGTILHTSDGGATWLSQYSGTDAQLNCVYFIDAHRGWIAGGSDESTKPGTLLQTTDGGQTWTLQHPIAGDALASVCFADSKHGWAVGGRINVPSGDRLVSVGVILATIDGGKTWSPQLLSHSYAYRSVDFVDATTGWVVGDRSQILKTTDGGATWQRQKPPKTPGRNYYPRNVFMLDRTTGWIAAGSILRTSDGGSTWAETKMPADSGVFSVYFVDAEHGWAVGADGRNRPGLILHSIDGGRTWSRQSSGLGGEQDFNSVFFVRDGVGWTVGLNDNGATILHVGGSPR